MHARTAPLLLVAILAIASAGAAAAQPAIYFMRDVDDRPIGDATLEVTAPPPADLNNPANNTPPSVRNVGPFLHEQFVRPTSDNNTGWLVGPVIIGLWAPETPLIDEATLVIEFGLFTAGTNPLMQDAEVLASARVPIEGGNITPPDPMRFIPPDPTNPEGSANHIAAEAIAYAAPMLLQAPYVLLLENNGTQVLNQEVPVDAKVGVRFILEPPNGSALPLPVGAGQPIEYDFGLAPSFLYVPWYVPDPAPTNQPSSSTTTSSSTTSGAPTTIGPEPTEDEKDSPVPVLVPLALLIALLVRRRIRA